MKGPAICLLLALAIAGCGRKEDDRVQGYVEGEFVYVASPLAGELRVLGVRRGANVAAGTPLFALECDSETAVRDQAAGRLAEGRSHLADARKGLRETEVDAIEAQLHQARAALVLSETEFARQSELVAKHAVPVQDFDKAKSARDQDRNRVAQFEAELQTARLGSRSDQVAAGEASVKALEAALAKAEWDLKQKLQDAPMDSLVFDTLFEQGEWVPAGRPIVSLLPPGNVKVRAFVPEPRLGSLQLGGTARVSIDGAGEVSGRISFISPQAEFTPPVIYSQETRSKLVFLVEIVFEPGVAAKLHPGQPVDVRF